MTRVIHVTFTPFAAPAMPSSPIDAAAAAVIDIGEISEDASPAALRPGGLIKRMLPRTMFGRSLLLIVMPLVLVQIIATWVFYARHWETVSRRLANDVAGDIGLLIDATKYADNDAETARLLEKASSITLMQFTLNRGRKLPGG